MARARNIKPALFKNELLGVADPLLTILFTSLWCLADREGRLEDRPLRIKAETFPYRENININGYLTELERLGFIRRYSVDGMAIIQVQNFTKHQTPHKTERPSELPEENPESHASSSYKEITVKAPLNNSENTEALPPDSSNTDSSNTDSSNTDYLITDSGEAKTKKTKPDRSPTGSRLPTDWAPSEADTEYCKTERPDLDVNRVAEDFRDYWHSKAGADARKTDWPATWRGWVRRQNLPRGSPSNKTPSQLGKAGQATALAAQRFLEGSDA